MIFAKKNENRTCKWWHNSFLYNDYSRLWRLKLYYGVTGLRYLLPWHLYLDYIEIPITTRCNLCCPDCANLMPLYKKPYDIDAEMIIRSIQTISECFDICGQMRVLGGEPFLHPNLKQIIEAIPNHKCKKISIPTNATIIPRDPELYRILREKGVVIVLGNYPAATHSQEGLIAQLEAEGIKYELPRTETWINYGNMVNHHVEGKKLTQQFTRCNLRSKSLLNGILYYCPRHAHGCDLEIIERLDGEYVNLFHNTPEQNRRQIRRLMWRHRPVEACKFCLRGTEKAISISRGK